MGRAHSFCSLTHDHCVWASDRPEAITLPHSACQPFDPNTFLLQPPSLGTPHVFTAIGNKQAWGLVVAVPSAFARLVATVKTQERANPLDIELFDRISAEIGDEILGSLGTLTLRYHRNVLIGKPSRIHPEA
ncbi:MAG: hypothetical protein H7Z11_10900 [Verrucomicrobia bacterium]|nr:hypothetical protein [Leptolyngbya sp. ES-bin-22]